MFKRIIIDKGQKPPGPKNRMPAEPIKDTILFARLKKKDREAFIEAYDNYLDQIYRFIFYKVSDRELAEDLTSSVFLKSWDYIQNNRIKDYKTLKSLFYKVARNLVIDHYRKFSNNKDVPLTAEGLAGELSDEQSDLNKKFALASDIDFLKEKMDELKEEYREVLILRYINELSITEIAAILDKGKGNVRVIIYRAIKALREIAQEKTS